MQSIGAKAKMNSIRLLYLMKIRATLAHLWRGWGLLKVSYQRVLGVQSKLGLVAKSRK